MLVDYQGALPCNGKFTGHRPPVCHTKHRNNIACISNKLEGKDQHLWLASVRHIHAILACVHLSSHIPTHVYTCTRERFHKKNDTHFTTPNVIIQHFQLTYEPDTNLISQLVFEKMCLLSETVAAPNSSFSDNYINDRQI